MFKRSHLLRRCRAFRPRCTIVGYAAFNVDGHVSEDNHTTPLPFRTQNNAPRNTSCPRIYEARMRFAFGSTSTVSRSKRSKRMPPVSPNRTTGRSSRVSCDTGCWRRANL
jgi:hypothetical protein